TQPPASMENLTVVIFSCDIGDLRTQKLAADAEAAANKLGAGLILNFSTKDGTVAHDEFGFDTQPKLRNTGLRVYSPPQNKSFAAAAAVLLQRLASLGQWQQLEFDPSNKRTSDVIGLSICPAQYSAK